MNTDNKNTELDNTDKKLHISDVSGSFPHTSGGFEQSFKYLIENGYIDDVMKKVLHYGRGVTVQIIDLANKVKENYH